jgi:hypothetical protein
MNDIKELVLLRRASTGRGAERKGAVRRGSSRRGRNGSSARRRRIGHGVFMFVWNVS